jgi:hypothetical protein
MKSLNQRILEEVLDPMFPGEFTYFEEAIIRTNNLKTSGQYHYVGHAFCFSYDLEDAFYLAEKVGLFEKTLLSKSFDGKKWIIVTDGECGVIWFDAIKGETIPEVICKAVLTNYGRKE